jgi:hypothetical protein
MYLHPGMFDCYLSLLTGLVLLFNLLQSSLITYMLAGLSIRLPGVFDC